MSMAPTPAVDLYISLLKASLNRTVTPPRFRPITPRSPVRKRIMCALGRVLATAGLALVRRTTAYDLHQWQEGLSWPEGAETMIGRKRLDQLQQAVETVLREGIPGDLIETGVWRGGA